MISNLKFLDLLRYVYTINACLSFDSVSELCITITKVQHIFMRHRVFCWFVSYKTGECVCSASVCSALGNRALQRVRWQS